MCKTLVLYHNGPLMYVYVCIQMRCLILGGREGGRENEGGREGGREERCIIHSGSDQVLEVVNGRIKSLLSHKPDSPPPKFQLQLSGTASSCVSTFCLLMIRSPRFSYLQAPPTTWPGYEATLLYISPSDHVVWVRGYLSPY